VVITSTVVVADDPSRPNILVFLADDMTYTDMGCFGNQEVTTPHLDAIAKQGMRLTHCFSTSPMCAPTRQSLYSGLFPVRNGAHPNHSFSKPDTRSLPHFLRPLGYRVGLIGKQHFGPEESYPFEILGNVKEIDFLLIDEFVNRDPQQPYCLIVASKQPHAPWDRGDASAYDPRRLTLPPYLVDTPQTREALASYYAEITYMDGQVGRCKEIVDASKQAMNTLMLFFSEQGSSLPLCKWTLYDTGIRAAGIAHWPKRVKAGSTSAAIVQYVDVVPTVVEMAGGAARDDLDGRSFLDVLTGNRTHHRDYAFAIQTSRGITKGPTAYGIRAVRSDRYKLILNLNADQPFANKLTYSNPIFQSWQQRASSDSFAQHQVQRYVQRPELEFYDLASDPFETKNLASVPGHQSRMAELRSELDSWMRQQGDRGKATELEALDRVGPHRKQRFLRYLESGTWN